MPIDAEQALSARPSVRDVTWTSRDVLPYHLSLGAGAHADRDPELRWTFERDPRVLPTVAMVAGQEISVGDRNPLHADPGLAGMAGFDRPILHGLASCGVVAEAVVDGLLGGDPGRPASLSVRFAGSVLSHGRAVLR